jgi:hypothetical protein
MLPLLLPPQILFSPTGRISRPLFWRRERRPWLPLMLVLPQPATEMSL